MPGAGVSMRGALAQTSAPLLGFRPVPVSEADAVTVPEGYRAQVLARWGDAISGGMPAFHGANSGEEQAHQLGQNHDGQHFFPIEGQSPYEGSSEGGRYGWHLEIDPFDPDKAPVKRTHLGRFAHEGVVFHHAEAGKPVVCYSGDDSRFDYIYKFVSRDVFVPGETDGSILDHGTRYVARFDPDGSGEWLALAPGHNGLTPEAGFADLADILVNTRAAADHAGATKMDRPEWGAGDPAMSRTFEGAALGEDDIFAAPDGIWFDADARLRIQTDIGESAQNRGDFAQFGTNQILAADPRTGEIRRFLTGPVGQEITGVCTTPDQRTMFVGIQHPGSTTTPEEHAAGRLASHWPDGGDAVPRSALVVITREDGGKIGA
jgi:secreted PhoX family phosphatase